MHAFVRVVERSSFAGAATILGLTPSAVSKLVSKLEDRLGVRLVFLHMVDAVGIVHAMLLRVQAFLMPVKILVGAPH